ncbi:hypothetical protein N9R54_05195 [Pelobium sp.]|nr:hypothetical protein [Pelobium sp.]MDA9555614.1 hypothetical protein [Pelobium sp.]
MKKSAEEIANEILTGLDSAEQAVAPPFLHTRILQGIKNEQMQKTKPSLVWRYAFSACLLMFLAFNIFALSQYFKDKTNAANTNIEAIVKEYGIGENNTLNI